MITQMITEKIRSKKSLAEMTEKQCWEFAKSWRPRWTRGKWNEGESCFPHKPLSL